MGDMIIWLILIPFLLCSWFINSGLYYFYNIKKIIYITNWKVLLTPFEKGDFTTFDQFYPESDSIKKLMGYNFPSATSFLQKRKD